MSEYKGQFLLYSIDLRQLNSQRFKSFENNEKLSIFMKIDHIARMRQQNFWLLFFVTVFCQIIKKKNGLMRNPFP